MNTTFQYVFQKHSETIRYEGSLAVTWEEFYIYGIIWLYYFIFGFSFLICPRHVPVFFLQCMTTLPAWVGYVQGHAHDTAWINACVKMISLGFTNVIYFRFHFAMLIERPFQPYVTVVYFLLDLLLAQAQTLYWLGGDGSVLEECLCLLILSASVTVALDVTKRINHEPEEIRHLELVFYPLPRPVVTMSGDG